MTVKELKEKLNEFPDDLKVCFEYKLGWYDVNRLRKDNDFDLNDEGEEYATLFVVLSE